MSVCRITLTLDSLNGQRPDYVSLEDISHELSNFQRTLTPFSGEKLPLEAQDNDIEHQTLMGVRLNR